VLSCPAKETVWVWHKTLGPIQQWTATDKQQK
jgi:hypothetical protein